MAPLWGTIAVGAAKVLFDATVGSVKRSGFCTTRSNSAEDAVARSEASLNDCWDVVEGWLESVA